CRLRSSAIRATIGLLSTGATGFGITYVSGRSRVPSPAARIIALIRGDRLSDRRRPLLLLVLLALLAALLLVLLLRIRRPVLFLVLALPALLLLHHRGRG